MQALPTVFFRNFACGSVIREGKLPAGSRPFLIFACLVAVAALLVLPVAAADTTPALHTVGIRQAHLAWTALDKDVEMNAAVTYCGTLYGSDTTTMSRLLAEFRAEEARIPSAATGKELDMLIAEMRTTTGQFRSETWTVMTKGQGKWDDLEAQIAKARDNNPYIQEKKDTYWAVRKASQLADFDAWVDNGQQILDTLKAGGYDTTSAQRALDVFSSKRPEVEAALTARSELAVQSAGQQILPLSQEFNTKLALVQNQVPDSIRLQFFIDQADRAVGLADGINTELVPIMLDIGDAEPVLSKTKTDLTTARKVLATGNLESTKVPLRLVKKDLVDLAEAYRNIRVSVSLPAALSTELETMVIRLENTADTMGAAL
ncbi:hypothetical protein [Methanoregula sp.]|uniref:hypothetical protein n=1 Tax=Methanoregula sp. TaxID=2052170 RepID=UPI00236C7441|nr:hypothetical protein [Methanoregula sp.]MDD1687403.1 hypothetical protein [Methanoregula sp.]